MYTCRKQRCTGSREGWIFLSQCQEAAKAAKEAPEGKKSVWGTSSDLAWGDPDASWGEAFADDWGLSNKPSEPKSKEPNKEKPTHCEEEGRKCKSDSEKGQERPKKEKEEEKSSWELNKSTWWYNPFYIAFEFERRRIGLENEDVRIPDALDEKGGSGDVEEEATWTSADQEIEFGLRLRENPEQLLRYHYKGNLLSAVLDGSGASEEEPLGKYPKCDQCGVTTTFEFQLMPNLIRVLKEVAQCEYVHLMEWTTVIVFTCHRCYQCKWVVQCL